MLVEEQPTGGGFSLDRAQERERRGGIRHVKVLKVAKMIFGAHEELCIVRDISSGGLKAEIYFPLNPGDAVAIELNGGTPVSGHVAWRTDDIIGVMFDRPVSVIAVIAHRTLDRLGRRVRRPRLKADFTGWIVTESGEREVHVGDVSQAGMKARIDRRMSAGQLCEVKLPGLDSRRAFVRWYRDGFVGLQFALPMAYPEFAQWRREVGGYEGMVSIDIPRSAS